MASLALLNRAVSSALQIARAPPAAWVGCVKALRSMSGQQVEDILTTWGTPFLQTACEGGGPAVVLAVLGAMFQDVDFQRGSAD